MDCKKIDELLKVAMDRSPQVSALMQALQMVQGGISGAQGIAMIIYGYTILYASYLHTVDACARDKIPPPDPADTLTMRIIEHVEGRCGCEDCPFRPVKPSKGEPSPFDQTMN